MSYFPNYDQQYEFQITFFFNEHKRDQGSTAIIFKVDLAQTWSCLERLWKVSANSSLAANKGKGVLMALNAAFYLESTILHYSTDETKAKALEQRKLLLF